MTDIRVRTLLVLSLILTLLSAFITYLNQQQKKEATDIVIHNYKVIQASTRLLSSLKDMEIGHRGYLITADTSFLSPYLDAVSSIEQDMDTLSQLVINRPVQSDILENHIIPLVRMKEIHLTESFEILRRYGRDSASHFAGMRIEKDRMDSIRTHVQDIITKERSLLAEGNASLEQRYLISDIIRFSSFALIGITSFAALITIANKERANKKLLEELRVFNLVLEEKVKSRTRELESANQNLTRLNAEKNHFLAIATHDLKAPLAGINGLLALMRMDKEILSSRHLEYIQLMEETCSSMQNLVSDLLDLSNIEQGTTRVNIEEVPVNRLFTQLQERFGSWAGKKKIELSFEMQGGKLLNSDPSILTRILDNLISNAIKFSRSGTIVTVRCQTNETQTTFEVIDQGPGIQPADMDKLFKRFQKLTARPTDGESSSGLGLSIVKDLVSTLKGSIQLDSTPGKGSTFSVVIPNVQSTVS